MTRLRIDVAYDGAPFAGFARQPDQTTVQGTLEGALTRVLGQPVRTTGAGRTDRGVHALAQVVHLDVDPAAGRAARALADLEVLRERLDHLVGPAVTVWSVRVVPETFDARFSATGRGYRYRLVDAAVADPIRRHDRWQVGEPLELPAMRRAAAPLVGEHDFASFCRPGGGSTVRRLDRLSVRPAGEVLEIRARAESFLHQMVRSLVGTLVAVGEGRLEPGTMRAVLAARDRAAAGPVAPPDGLTLVSVHYGANPRARRRSRASGER
jgi:tRNA pseudouridine38-40 synthase